MGGCKPQRRDVFVSRDKARFHAGRAGRPPAAPDTEASRSAGDFAYPGRHSLRQGDRALVRIGVAEVPTQAAELLFDLLGLRREASFDPGSLDQGFREGIDDASPAIADLECEVACVKAGIPLTHHLESRAHA